MSDPFTLAVQTAAAALGLKPAGGPGSPFTYDELLRWATYRELKELTSILERLLAEGRRVLRVDAMSVIPVELARRAQLRRDLDLGTKVENAHAQGLPSLRIRKCVEPWPRTVKGCRCVEDAIGEAAVAVEFVDREVVVMVRARARVLHARFVRRLEKARARNLRGHVRVGGVTSQSRSHRSMSTGSAPTVDPSIATSIDVAVPLPSVARPPAAVRASVVARGRIDEPGDLDKLSMRLTGKRAEKAPPSGVVR